MLSRGKRLDKSGRFLVFLALGVIFLSALILLYLCLGAQNYALSDVFSSLFHYNPSLTSHYFIRQARLPRLIADLIVGASLSLAGLLMQGTTKNPMADSGLMGISQGSTLGIVMVIAFFPAAGRFEKMGWASLGALFVTALIYLIAFLGKRRATPERMVLSGMAVSTLLSSICTAIIIKNGLTGQLIRYSTGSSANVIWADLEISLPFFVGAVLLSLLISHLLTVMNLGEDVSKGLGVNVKIARLASTLIVLILTALAVVIIGPVSYIGLLIPYIARHMVGNDYRFSIPLTIIYGALFVVGVDLLAKSLKPGIELPVGLLVTMIGVPFFIYTARRQKGDHFYD